MLNPIARWAARLASLLLLLFWGSFFLEHLSEWFFHGGTLPPAAVWAAMLFHFVMLAGLALMLKWETPGVPVMLAGTIAFFATIGFHRFPLIALWNLVPAALFAVERMLRPKTPGFGK